ncbi:MAG: hypothetical protein ABIN35_06990 [candidate division WOR-3 bacterium]
MFVNAFKLLYDFKENKTRFFEKIKVQYPFVECFNNLEMFLFEEKNKIFKPFTLNLTDGSTKHGILSYSSISGLKNFLKSKNSIHFIENKPVILNQIENESNYMKKSYFFTRNKFKLEKYGILHNKFFTNYKDDIFFLKKELIDSYNYYNDSDYGESFSYSLFEKDYKDQKLRLFRTLFLILEQKNEKPKKTFCYNFKDYFSVNNATELPEEIQEEFDNYGFFGKPNFIDNYFNMINIKIKYIVRIPEKEEINRFHENKKIIKPKLEKKFYFVFFDPFPQYVEDKLDDIIPITDIEHAYSILIHSGSGYYFNSEKDPSSEHIYEKLRKNSKYICLGEAIQFPKKI